jgi:hypothetical protein
MVALALATPAAETNSDRRAASCAVALELPAAAALRAFLALS